MARLPTPSPAVRWILSVGIIVGLLATGFVYYNRLKSEQSNLLTSIAQSSQNLNTFRAIDLSELEAEIADLETRAKAADLRSKSLAARYQGYVHSIEIEERLYEAAAEADVTITRVTCAGPQNEEVEGVTFTTYTMDVDAEADVPPQLLNFIIKLSDSFESGTVESVDMSIPMPPEEGTTAEMSTVSLGLRLFCLPREAA
jgi:hypothetical protein